MDFRVTRRSLIASFGAMLAPRLSFAKLRPIYGGTLRLTLPIELTNIDPHDPESLAGELLGPCLFDTLFGRTPEFGAYPTLAALSPVRSEDKLVVRLRTGLTFSNGSVLDARAVIAALERSRASTPWLRLPPLRAKGTEELEFTTPMAPDELARLLAEPLFSITAPKFSPKNPIGSGAFRLRNEGNSLRFERNSLAPRGGAFLDTIAVKSAPLGECLRQFEAKESDLGFLGLGLHENRKDAAPFVLPATGLGLLHGGRGLKAFGASGVLESVISQSDLRPLEALGYRRERTSGNASLGNGPFELLVPEGDHLLQATAEALSELLARGGTNILLRPLPGAAYRERRKSGDFDLALSFLRLPVDTALSADYVHRALLAQAGVPAPLSFQPEKPEKIARRLPLAFLGTFTPRGGLSAEVGQFSPHRPLNYGDWTLSMASRGV